MLLKLRLLTILIDYCLLIGAFSLAYGFRVGFILSSDLPFEDYLETAFLASLLWTLSLVIFRGYSLHVRFTRFIHFIKIFIAGLTGTAAFGLIYYFLFKTVFSRLLLLEIFLLGVFTMSAFHFMIQKIEEWLIGKGYGVKRLLIIGSHRGVRSFIEELRKNISPWVPVAILDGYGTSQKDISGVPILGKLNVLEETVKTLRIDAIVQADNVEQSINIVNFCERSQIDYYLLPYVLGMYQRSLHIAYLEQPLITPGGKKKEFWDTVLG